MDSIKASKPKFGSDARLLKQCSQKRRLKQLGMVKALDECHRELLDALDASNRYSNTIIIFFSDNGGNYPH